LIITSQVPIDRWHDIVGNPTLADAKGPACSTLKMRSRSLSDLSLSRNYLKVIPI